MNALLSLEERSLRVLDERARLVAKAKLPEQPANPLEALMRFAVTDEQVEAMTATRMIWRDIIASSHMAAWVAPANGGKTALATHAAGELAGDEYKVFYFQEDASAGDLPALFAHAKTHGYKLLNSTLAGCVPEEQIKVLRDLAKGGSDLAGIVIFMDTLKKFTDLMSKGGARTFFQLMRALTQRGATIVLLGHTNKHRGIDGKLIFEGVGDVRSDVDELLYIEATDKDPTGIVTLTMKPDKVRCIVKETTFRLDTRTMEVQALNHVIDVGAIRDAEQRRKEDAELIAVIQRLLSDGGMPHTKLVDMARSANGAKKSHIADVIERYAATGDDDNGALWNETRLATNNARHISLIPRRRS